MSTPLSKDIRQTKASRDELQSMENRKETDVALTRPFRRSIQVRAQRDPSFRHGLFEEAIEAFLSSDMETAKLLLRDDVNATLGFERIARNGRGGRIC